MQSNHKQVPQVNQSITLVFLKEERVQFWGPGIQIFKQASSVQINEQPKKPWFVISPTRLS